MLYIRVVSRLRRLVFAAMAFAGLAALGIAGLAPAASQAAVGTTCRWQLTPSPIWLTDPGARINVLGGRYNLPGQTGVAYKMTGQFPHATYFNFTSYNDVWQIYNANEAINDRQIVPDPGSTNPYIPRNLIAAEPRNYTVWVWPEGVPVPAGLGPNVMQYPTVPIDPRDTGARWSLAMRQYGTQPGFLPINFTPTVTAVSTTTLQPVRCPLRVRGTYASQIQSGLAKIRVVGPVVGAPTAPDNHIWFTRIPEQSGLGTDGYPADGCLGYLLGKLSNTELSVVTYPVANYFDNLNLAPGAVMQDWNYQWTSLIVAGFPFIRGVNQNDPLVHPRQTLTSVFLPGIPHRLPLAQEIAVRRAAAQMGFTVTQIQPDPKFTHQPLAGFIPYPDLLVRQKGIWPTFKGGTNAVPCWTNPHNPETAGNNWLDYDKQHPLSWWAKYSSQPSNMGPYSIQGVRESVAEFLQQSTK